MVVEETASSKMYICWLDQAPGTDWSIVATLLCCLLRICTVNRQPGPRESAGALIAPRLLCANASLASVHQHSLLGWQTPSWGMRVEKVYSLASISTSPTDLKEFKLHTVYQGISEKINLVNLLVRLQSLSWSQILAPAGPVQVIWQSLQKSIPEGN